MGEIGSLKNRFKVYKKNILLNKKKIKVKIKNYKEKNYKVNKIKKNSKIRNFFLIIIGFIFGFFDLFVSFDNILILLVLYILNVIMFKGVDVIVFGCGFI